MEPIENFAGATKFLHARSLRPARNAVAFDRTRKWRPWAEDAAGGAGEVRAIAGRSAAAAAAGSWLQLRLRPGHSAERVKA
jgi:hypothetical protein